MGVVAGIAQVALGIGGAVLSVLEFENKQDEIKRRSTLARENIDLERQARESERGHREAALSREARVRRGALANAAGTSGALRTSSFVFGQTGLETRERGELAFSQQQANFANAQDALRQQGVSIEASSARDASRFDLFSGLLQSGAVTAQGASNINRNAATGKLPNPTTPVANSGVHF